MIINVTVGIDLDNVTDPANVVTRVTEGLGVCLREVEGLTGFQVTRVMPEDEAPPVVAMNTTPEETAEDV